MKRETLNIVEAFIRSAVIDPTERDELLKRIAQKPQKERRDKMLTSKEAASIAEVHPKTILAWGRKGLLTARHITRRRVRFS